MREIEPLQYPMDAGDLIRRFENPMDGIDTAAQFVAMANIALRSAGVELVLKVDDVMLKDRHPTDLELVAKAVEQARRAGEEITDAAVRVIASLFHGGQNTAMYALASTGAIKRSELLSEAARTESEMTVPEDSAALIELVRYVKQHDDRGPVPGWSGLWLNQPTQEEDED